MALLGEEIRVSIIVPVYNAGENLAKCLDTLINQTEQKIEIICVLDAPTDGSDIVVRNYAQKDSRIKVIVNETNIHIAKSRNQGIQTARGEYISFSDHDDWRELNMYEELYKKAKSEDADIVISNGYIEKNGKSEEVSYLAPDKNGIIRSIILPLMSNKNLNFISRAVWSSIYKRDFILTNAILFPDRYMYHEEDTLFNLHCMLNANKISYVKTPFYHWNREGATESKKLDKSYARTQINMFNKMIALLTNHGEINNYQEELTTLVSTKIFYFFNFYKYMDKSTIQSFSSLPPRYMNLSKIEEKKIGMNDNLKFRFLKIKLQALYYKRKIKNILSN